MWICIYYICTYTYICSHLKCSQLNWINLFIDFQHVKISLIDWASKFNYLACSSDAYYLNIKDPASNVMGLYFLFPISCVFTYSPIRFLLFNKLNNYQINVS